MKHFAGWQAVFLSFFSADLYRAVVLNWRGAAFLYLFLLIAGSWVMQAVKLQNQVNRFVEQYAQETIRQFPKIRIDHGELSFDKPSPYYVKSANGRPIIIFDSSQLKDIKNPETGKPLLTDAESTAPKVDYAGPLIIAAKKEVIFFNGQKAQVDPLMGVDKVEVDQLMISSCVDAFAKWTGIIAFCAFVPFLFCTHAIQVLIYGLMAKIFTNIRKVELNYQQLLRLSVIAITPVIILDTLLRLFEQASFILNLWPIIAFGLALIYIYFGVNANSGQALSTNGATDIRSNS